MIREYLGIVAFGSLLVSCGSGNKFTDNYYDDGIYFDPNYGVELAQVEEPIEEEQDTLLPDYAYSESFDYYDPNYTQYAPPVNNNGYVYNPYYNYSNNYYNSTYNPYMYDDWGMYYGSNYGYGNSGWGYGHPGYVNFGYGYPNNVWGFGSPVYCPPGYGGGGSATPSWYGDQVTSSWHRNRVRTKFNGPKPGSTRKPKSTAVSFNGPKKVDNSNLSPIGSTEGKRKENIVNTLNTPSEAEVSKATKYYYDKQTKEYVRMTNVTPPSQVNSKNTERTRARVGNETVKTDAKYNTGNLDQRNNSTNRYKQTQRTNSNTQKSNVNVTRPTNYYSNNRQRSSSNSYNTSRSTNNSRSRSNSNSVIQSKPRANSNYSQRYNTSGSSRNSYTPSRSSNTNNNSNRYNSGGSSSRSSGSSRSSSGGSARSGGGSSRSGGGRR